MTLLIPGGDRQCHFARSTGLCDYVQKTKCQDVDLPSWFILQVVCDVSAVYGGGCQEYLRIMRVRRTHLAGHIALVELQQNDEGLQLLLLSVPPALG